jgi:outer membrane protein assembly factor BamB
MNQVIFRLLLAVGIGAASLPPVWADWPQWRGPTGTGAAPEATPPLTWSETRNVRWKLPLTGRGHSSPVVADGRVFLTMAVPVGEGVSPVFDEAPGSHDNVGVTHTHSFRVMAVDLASGTIAWEREVARSFPHEGGHATGSLASNSPVTDGQAVYAFFGSRGLYCLDASDGSMRWKRDLGRLTTHHAHGEGASPALHDGTLVVPWDQESGSRIFAFDAATGRELWTSARDEITSWATPLVAVVGGVPQVILSATTRIRAYDLASGRPVWECAGMSRNVIATPVAADGRLYCGCSYDRRAMIAISLEGAAGDITATDHVLWSTNQRTPYVPSPLLYDGRLYFLNHYQGILSCLTGATGDRAALPVRLKDIDDVYASPVGAAGRVYITDRSGLTVVVAHDASLAELARNQLDDQFSASAALTGPDLLLRGEKHLYCLREGAGK